MVSTSQKSTFFTCRLFQKTPGRLVPDGWAGPKSSGCRCHFRGFQLKLFILDIQNFGNGPVVKKLQLFEDAKFSKNQKNHRFYLGDSPSTLGPTVVGWYTSIRSPIWGFPWNLGKLRYATGILIMIPRTKMSENAFSDSTCVVFQFKNHSEQ